MKFQKGRSIDSEAAAKSNGNAPELDPLPREIGRVRWSTAFLMVGSAFVGATALAFWNRRTIANMRAQIEAQSDLVVSASSLDEEIY